MPLIHFCHAIIFATHPFGWMAEVQDGSTNTAI
jgi:hypothetical protein